MSRSSWRFKRTEVQRLIKAAQSTGLKIIGIEVAEDNIKILVADQVATSRVETSQDLRNLV
jgi:hypothetical protein